MLCTGLIPTLQTGVSYLADTALWLRLLLPVLTIALVFRSPPSRRRRWILIAVGPLALLSILLMLTHLFVGDTHFSTVQELPIPHGKLVLLEHENGIGLYKRIVLTPEFYLEWDLDDDFKSREASLRLVDSMHAECAYGDGRKVVVGIQ